MFFWAAAKFKSKGQMQNWRRPGYHLLCQILWNVQEWEVFWLPQAIHELAWTFEQILIVELYHTVKPSTG